MAAETSVTLKIRLPSGSTLEHVFDSSTLLSEVADWAGSQSGESKLLLSTSYPRKIYERNDQETVTLGEVPGMGSKGLLIAQRNITTEVKQDSTPYTAPGVLHVKSAAEYEKAKNATKGRLVVVDFSAEWCGPCKQIAPVFENLAKATPTATFIHVDVDKVQVDDSADVSGIPTFKFFKNGSLLHTFSGADGDQLKTSVAKFK